MYNIIITTPNGCSRTLATRTSMVAAIKLLDTWRVRWYANYGVISIERIWK